MPAPKGHPNYDTEGLAGRPKKYTKEYLDQLADQLDTWIKNPSNFWVKDFCLEKGINPQLMNDWIKVSDRFREALATAKQTQESRIFKGAMFDNFNAGMAKFALINNHGWADKTETKISGDSKNPLSVILDKSDGNSKDIVNDK